MLIAGCSPERPVVAPIVVFLNPAGNPSRQAIEPFRVAFGRHVLPFHPNAALDVRNVPADDLAAVRVALEPLKRQPPTAIVTIHTTIAEAVVREMPATPLVFLTMADPVLLGVVDHPIAPGRTNVTGFTSNVPFELKHLELLQEFVPGIRRVGVVSDSFWASGGVPKRLLVESTRLFGITVEFMETESREAVDSLAREGKARAIDAWFIPDTPFNRIHAEAIGRQIVASGKPSASADAGHLKHGGLFAYQALRPDPWPRMAEIVKLVLSGVPAKSIPFERPKRFRLSVNAGRAQALGVDIPRTIWMRADDVAS